MKIDDKRNYIVVKDSEVKFKTDLYKRVRVDDLDSNININDSLFFLRLFHNIL